jgi:hypothetical protein
LVFLTIFHPSHAKKNIGRPMRSAMATHVVSLLTDVRSDKRADVPIAFKEDGEAVEDQDDGEGDELNVSTFG